VPDGTPPPCAARPVVRGPSAYSVVVLVFRNLARDSAMALLAEGLADQITTNLATVPRLDVKSAASVREVLGRGTREPGRIGRTVGAQWIVDGQVPAGRTSVRVSVQLIRAARGSLRWAGTFEHSTNDLFSVVSAVADSVATAIVGELAAGERAHLAARPTASNGAYELYVRGRGALAEGLGQNLLVARALFEEAQRRDSAFAPALAALASTWISIADLILSPRDANPLARRAAERALRLDSANGEATAALAKIAMWYDWDLDGDVLMARRAVALAPRSPEAHLVLGIALVGRGDSAEGSRHLLEAADLDSLSARTMQEVMYALLYARRSSDLIARGRRLQATEQRLRGYRMEYRGLAIAGRCDEARVLLPRREYRWVPCAVPVEAAEAHVDSVAVEERRIQPFVRAWDLAKSYSAIGSRDKAFVMLEQAFRDREGWMPFMRLEPSFESLRDDPRFADLQRRVVAAAGRP